MRGLIRDEKIVLGLIAAIPLGMILLTSHPRTSGKEAPIRMAADRTLERTREALANHSNDTSYPEQEAAEEIITSQVRRTSLFDGQDIFYSSSPVAKDSKETLLVARLGSRSLVVPGSGTIQWHYKEVPMGGLNHLKLTSPQPKH